jgi:hypothetical protein
VVATGGCHGVFEFEWFVTQAVQTLSLAGLEGTYKHCTLQEFDLVVPEGDGGKNPKRLWCQRFGIARSQKRTAARTQPSALVPVPSPKPWPTFG